MDLDRHEVRVGETTVELTPAEFGLLKTFMENPETRLHPLATYR